MRDYGKVSPQFWLGKTGRVLRGNPNAQIVALYLMTSPHANMLGVFHCPVSYIAHETGLPLEGASEGLQSLVEGGFCTYDAIDEYVFVHEFASHQVGEQLKADDNRVKGIKTELSKLPEGQCRRGFEQKYGVAFHLDLNPKKDKPLRSPSQAPSKQLTGAGAGTEEEREADAEASCPQGFKDFWDKWPSGGRKGARSKCLDVWKAKKLERQSGVIVAHVVALKASDDWRKGFIPAPLVYLNGQKWDGAEVIHASFENDIFAGAK